MLEERIELSCASLGVTGLSVCRLGEHFNENSEIIFLILLKGTFLDYGKHLTATRQRSGQRNSCTLYTFTHQKGEWRAQWETWGLRTSQLFCLHSGWTHYFFFLNPQSLDNEPRVIRHHIYHCGVNSNSRAALALLVLLQADTRGRQNKD